MISGLSFADGNRKLRAHEILLEIHKSTLDLLAGKKGLIQERVLGKYTDYAVRGVLSGPTLSKSQRAVDQEVPFGYLGVPLYLAVNMFQPFIVTELSNLFSRIITGGQTNIVVATDSGQRTEEIPPAVAAQLTPELFKKWISMFMRSQESRLAPLAVPLPSGKMYELKVFDYDLGRPTTLVDLFFVIMSSIIEDKHVMFTRYPVEDFRACHFTKLKLLTTERTIDMAIRAVPYKGYPDIRAPVRWIDSFRFNNSYTTATGADFDGRRFYDRFSTIMKSTLIPYFG